MTSLINPTGYPAVGYLSLILVNSSSKESGITKARCISQMMAFAYIAWAFAMTSVVNTYWAYEKL